MAEHDRHASLYQRARSQVHRLVLRMRPDASLTEFQRFQRDGYTSLTIRGLSLTPDSTVLDVGGYLGDYTAAMRALYGCRVHIYEPVPGFAAALRERFADDEAVFVHEYGLADQDGTAVLRLSDDGTGMAATGEPVTVQLRSVATVAESLPIRIDVAAINIEGAEYDLIPALASAGVLARIDRLFVQFHDLSPDSITDREVCRAILSRTHRCEWAYDFIWESWVRV